MTGAASGIGRATAATFVKLGAHVVLVDRDKCEPLDPKRTTSYRADMTIEGEVRAAVAHACRTFGGLDILVSNAGDAPQGRLDTSEGDEALRASLEVNLLSHNHAARAASEMMIAQGRGGSLLFNASKARSTRARTSVPTRSRRRRSSRSCGSTRSISGSSASARTR